MGSRRSIVLAAALIAVPVGALTAMRLYSDDELNAVSVRADPMVVLPTTREVRDLQRLNVVLTWEEGAVVRAPGWSGMVTAVSGDPEMEEGRPVLAIDGIDRIARASAEPFYRALASGDRGADVGRLHELLLATGFIDAMPADSEFLSFGTSLAVEQFNASLGLMDSRVFDPGTVIWLPFAPFPVETMEVEVGAPAPAPGSVIATGPATLLSAVLQAQNPAEPISLEPGVPYVLVKGQARLAFDAEMLTLPGEGLAALAALVEPLAEQTDAVIERETPLEVLAVPSTAIVANGDGDLCAWVVDASDDAGYRPVDVTLAGSQAGVTNVATGLGAEEEVLANPSAVLEEWVCP
ncbi:MAG: hypothetical protein KC482_05205 [Dehalococcoidia bacterium]|nr:hypothetical protein [Dehalococcoidia bacterium]MCA9852983.1 hypothetical protein [Dehalococcoidia bacterium]